jgi:hypothetical protein
MNNLPQQMYSRNNNFDFAPAAYANQTPIHYTDGNLDPIPPLHFPRRSTGMGIGYAKTQEDEFLNTLD